MQLLEQRILAEGEVKSSEILKVDRFLNHQMDPKLFLAMAEEWKRLFDGCGVNKLVTIEASGIGIAAVAGLVFDCPVVFAKKTKSRNVSDDAYTTVVHSFTHGNDNTIRISREYLSPSDRVLVIDDFLANGAALDGLITLIEGAWRAGRREQGCVRRIPLAAYAAVAAGAHSFTGRHFASGAADL